jgi:hypothetical protein
MNIKESLNKDIPKIILVGCAKNEACYLPEWIFYHLSLGFSAVHIYINNTDDASVKLLDKIAAKFPVSYTIADKLIESPPSDYIEKTNQEFFTSNRVQSVCYIDAYNRFDSGFDHIAFFDIDEFFYPLTALKDLFLQTTHNTVNIKRFGWFNLAGDKHSFLNLDETALGAYDVFFKSIVPTGVSNLKIENEHTASIGGNTGELDPSAIILHRVLRSKEEYLVLLARSTPQKTDLLVNGFKQNRRGWTSRASDRYPRDVDIFDNYKTRFKSFIKACDIEDELELSKQKLLDKYKTIKISIEMMKQQNTELVRSLNGLPINHVSLFKTFSHTIIWGGIKILFPNLILNHIGIKEYFLSKFSYTNGRRR